MTTGGLGVAFFSPFSNARYFLPWQVIRVSPIGLAPFFSHRGFVVLGSEWRWIRSPALAFSVIGIVVRRMLRVP